MRRFKFNRAFAATVIMLFASLMVVVGCSENPIGADSKAEPKLLVRSAEFVSSGQLSTTSFYAEKVIPAATGGQLQLLDVTLDIPAYAVPSDTLFSIEIPDLMVFYNEFGTSGLVFNKPVKVTMSYRTADLSGVDESTIRIGWYNPSSQTYQDVECTIDFVNKTVTGYLNHFSAYALISDEE